VVPVERHTPRDPAASPEQRRLLWGGVGRRLEQRAQALGVVRSYFAAEQFCEVDTPIRVRTPGLDVHVDALSADGGYLITSPEFHMKRLLSAGMPRIFQLVHASRADEAGALHEPEFMMLEWYRAFSDSSALLCDTEQIVSRIVSAVHGGALVPVRGGLHVNFEPPYERLTVRDAFARFAGIADAVELAEQDEDRYFELLVGVVEPALARFERPVFLCDYPLRFASLARPAPHDSSVAERFELYAAGVELCNGFAELTDPREQRARFERDLRERRALGRPLYPVDESFLKALEAGLPPCSGNALGFDRVLMLASCAERIADVQAFPAVLV
jgi:lysyl-tRNA synthetase class 2